MGFLDRMVSDMIKRETGFNARRIVRRVGGRNLLMLGGAAIAGGVLASQAHSRSRSAAQAAGATTLPPTRSVGGTGPGLPPVPQATPDLPPVPQAAAELPPLPTAGGESAEVAAEIPGELLYAIVRTMVAAALADGELAPEEKRAIDERLSESGLSADQIAQVRRDLIVPASVEELAELLPEGEDPEVLAEFAVLVGRADGVHNELETAWLQSLAQALALPGERIDQLTSEIFT